MPSILCPQCAQETPDGKFCMHCQSELHPQQAQGRQKVACPNCGKQTFEARYCLYCRGEIRGKVVGQDQEIKRDRDESGIVLKARAAHGEQEAVSVVHISMAEQLPNGSLPQVKRLVVQPGSFTYIVSQMHEQFKLGPGQYDPSQLELGGVRSSLGVGESRPAFLCTVSQRPIVATFFLPDFDALKDESGNIPVPGQGNWDVDGAVRQLSLRTADNLLGGASAQMVLCCTNPTRLLEMFIHRRLSALSFQDRKQLGLLSDEERASLSEEERKRLGVAPAKAKYEGFLGKFVKLPFKLLGEALFGGAAEAVRYPQTISISMLDVYRQIRMEFAAAIIECIRNDTVEQLYNTVEIRERIAGDIQKVMSQSFEMYGLKIERVSAFRFICPEFDAVLKRRQDISLDREQLIDRKKEMEIGRQQRQMAAEEARDVSTVETELQTKVASDEALLERHKLKEARDTERDRDLLRAEQLKRQLEMDAEAHRAKLEKEDQQHQLEMEKERRRLQLQAEKMEMALGWQQRALQMQNQQQDVALERRIKMIEQYARLPKDSILTIALAENPQLAAAYAASVQSQSQEERLQMQEKFRQELSTAYSSNNVQFSKLLKEAVQQWGQYQTAKVQGANPQQVINVTPPRALPNESNDRPAQ